MTELKIDSLSEFKARFRSVALTLQQDFGVSYDYKTGDADDRRAMKMAIAVLDELDIQIKSDDEEVYKYINKLRKQG